ncbi:MAG: hypothetical protein LC643_01070 [Bacteroidales bacterium]|nr:hypothetical protein [Bacteroidales bacterium]
MEDFCPNTPKCPIFNGILSGKEVTSKSYRRLYCEGGNVRYSTCKRYMANQRFGSCPGNLLPNSTLSLDEIGERYNMESN